MPPKKKEESVGEFVTKEYFDNKFSQLVDIVGKLAEQKPVTTETDLEKSAKPDETIVNPGWRELVDEYLGKDFGMQVTYPKTGASFNFKVLVPRQYSNATPAHWDLYKCDIRTKAIGNNEGVDGIKQFLSRVRQNLKLDKPKQ